MTANIPGYPVNFQANLPVAVTMTTALPGRTVTTNSATNVIILAKRWNGQ
jgi:hypothetical protein